MLFSSLCAVSEQIKRTRSRTAKIGLLSDLLRELDPDEVALASHYLSGSLPQGRIGVGYAGLGEIGAEPASQPVLSLAEVDARLTEIKAIRGAGSARERQERLGSLFSRATLAEQVFLKSLLSGELRQGALEGIMVEGVAGAFAVEVDAVRRAFMVRGELAPVAAAIRREGKAALSRFRLELFRPVGPMLAQPGEDLIAAVQATRVEDRGWLEYKVDGARVQVHRVEDEVRVYSRELHDITHRVPELVRLAKELEARSFIADGEAIALDAGGRPLPFQDTMRRLGRKHEVGGMSDRIPLSLFLFDLLHQDGGDILDSPLEERRAGLDRIAPPGLVIPMARPKDPLEAQAFLEQALKLGHEGLMAKHAASSYQAGRRGGAWLKIKPVHTLDLVVLAVEWGSGRRQGLLSNLHLGARGPDGNFIMLGKTFKGMTDTMLSFQTRVLSTLAIAEEGHVVRVRPELVVEVAFDGVQKSPQYPGGLALRFARVKRYRQDKKASEADTLESVQAIYRASRGAAHG